jgi:hypothetical protein
MRRLGPNYWLVSYTVHAADSPHWQMTAREWPIECDSIDSRVQQGDYVYLINSDGVFAWGTAASIRPNVLMVRRGVFQSLPIARSVLQSQQELQRAFTFPNGRFNLLLNRQVKVLNSTMPNEAAPPTPEGEQFVLGLGAFEDEGLHTEYKDVSKTQIANEACEYAVAYLNQAGGRVLFGIRDSDQTVVGINAISSERDRIKRAVEHKLSQTVPGLSAVEHYWLEFHVVIDEAGNVIQDLHVFEVEINEDGSKTYQTAGGKIYVKNFSGRQRIT